jgi:hypothetical protein
MRRAGLVIGICGALGLAACGGSSSPAAPTSVLAALTEAQISSASAAVALAVLQAMSAAVSTPFVVMSSARAGRVQPASTTLPTRSVPCTGGGSISLDGTVDANFRPDGSGQEIVAMTIGFSSCNSAGVILNGNPNLSTTETISFSSHAGAGMISAGAVSMNMSGGILFTFNGTNGSATFNCASAIDTSVTPPMMTSSGTAIWQVPGQSPVAVSCPAL